PVGAGVLGQTQTSLEDAAAALDAQELLALLGDLGVLLAADREHALVERHLDVLRVDAREVDADAPLLAGLGPGERGGGALRLRRLSTPARTRPRRRGTRRRSTPSPRRRPCGCARRRAGSRPCARCLRAARRAAGSPCAARSRACTRSKRPTGSR